MAKVTNFECDVCKIQSKKIQEVQVVITPMLLNNGDAKPTTGSPTSSSFQICGDKCACSALERVFKKLEVVTVSASAPVVESADLPKGVLDENSDRS